MADPYGMQFGAYEQSAKNKQKLAQLLKAADKEKQQAANWSLKLQRKPLGDRSVHCCHALHCLNGTIPIGLLEFERQQFVNCNEQVERQELYAQSVRNFGLSVIMMFCICHKL